MTVRDLLDRAGLPPVIMAIVKGLMPAGVLDKPVVVRIDERDRRVTLDIGETRCIDLGFEEVENLGG